MSDGQTIVNVLMVVMRKNNRRPHAATFSMRYS
jgi:hypothetical protein